MSRTALVALLTVLPTLGPQAIAVARSPRPLSSGIATSESEPNPPVRVRTESFATFDASGAQTGEADWRVIDGTGNCCEQLLTSTPDGRMLNLGGSFPFVSRDEGATWTEVSLPLVVNAEGDIKVAPNGDIVGITWDAYSGDRLVAVRQDHTTGAWSWLPVTLHEPFHDRPWLTVIPGPVEFRDQMVPYLAVAQSGTSRDLSVVMISGDGLHYTKGTIPYLGQLRNTPPLRSAGNPSMDWLQPIGSSGDVVMRPGAIAYRVPVYTDTGDNAWDSPTIGYQFHDGHWSLVDGPVSFRPETVDSLGRVHAIEGIGNGDLKLRVGRRAHQDITLNLPLPSGYVVGDADLKANAQLGIDALALRVRDREGAVHNIVYKIAVTNAEATLVRYAAVGLGDLRAGSDVTAMGPRMDFESVTILASGHIALSFIDSNHTRPAVAVEE